MIVHKIKSINDSKTKCGKDTINVAIDGEKLSIAVFTVTCEKCRKLMPELNYKIIKKV